MKHFLITRFNLKNKKILKNNAVVNPLSKEWLDQRFHIFETYCLPSIINQTNQNFIWVVCFDSDTPEDFKPRVEDISRSYSNFKPIYVDGFSSLKPAFLNYIGNNISENDEFIITTRADNDDILHKDFIKTIQELYLPQNKTVIDLSIGYQFILKKDKMELLSFRNKFNPFVSVIESTKNDFETVISKQHREWENSSSTIIYEESPLWIQLIHDQNLINKKNRSLKKAYKFDHENFSLTQPISAESYGSVFLYNLINLPIRMILTLKKGIQFFFKSSYI